MQEFGVQSVYPRLGGMGGRIESELVPQPYLLLWTVFREDVPFSHNTYVTDDRQTDGRHTVP